MPVKYYRHDDLQYIVSLLGQVITVSLETVKTVKAIAPLSVAAGHPPSQKAGSSSLDNVLETLAKPAHRAGHGRLGS